MPRYKRSLFIFRRDLRVEDNTALNQALQLSEEVIPCFIFDPRLADSSREYFNHHAFQFLLECLDDLQLQLEAKNGNLFFFSALPEDVIRELVSTADIEAVFFNRDYTPFSIKRDEILEGTCGSLGIAMHSHHDALFNEPGTVLTKEGKPYAVFSPFFKRASKEQVSIPSTQEGGSFYSEISGDGQEDLKSKGHAHGSDKGKNNRRGSLKKDDSKGMEGTWKWQTELQSIASDLTYNKSECLFTKGGREHAISVLEDINDHSDYDNKRDYPSIKGTTGLSAHNKLGTVSIREFYYYTKNELGPNHTLISELYWRDFFTSIAVAFPHVFSSAFKQKFDALSWSDDIDHFESWCAGKTGFPIVDAGMRELNTTGYMHNRVRMIVASFLVKDLHIDWRWGERYFASQLVDYDPCVNNGNWQWSASTGADSQPYFRIFNPWLQQKKFDPKCAYIKKWVPELKDLDPKLIHALEKNDPPDSTDYPVRMLDHKVERKRALDIFGSV